MEIYLPVDATVGAVATAIGFVTEGLDAVAISQKKSGDRVRVVLAGNARDLNLAAERATKLGGTVG